MSEKQLRDAFDRITPSDETKQAMLDNILKAAEAGQTAAPVVPIASKRRKRSQLLDAALPIAACLVLLAGVGSLAVTGILDDPARYIPAPAPVSDPATVPAPAEPTPAPDSDPASAPAPAEALPAPGAAPSQDAEAVADAPVFIDEPAAALVVPSNESSLPRIVSITAIAVSLLTLIAWGCCKLLSRRKNKN